MTISVATGDDYVVATGDDGRILVRFVTQTTIPELSIAGPTSSEIEGGENLIFTITANNSTEVDLAIPVAIADHRSQNNANFVDEATYYVRLESGTTSATLPVSTNPDTTDEDDGVVSATIQADSGTVGYTIKTNSGTAYADVWDDDGATPPILSVTAMEESIREGTMANFTVTRTGGDMTNRLAFRYRIIPTEIGAPDSSPLVVRFDANSNTFPIRVRTVDIGNVLTLNANIAVKIDSPRDYPTAEYRVNEDMQIARVPVTDTSQPIYISKVFENVIPGEKFTFKVDTIPAAPTDLTINISARDAQNNSLTVSEVKILRGKTSAIGEVTTVDGDATTLDKVTVTVNASGSLYAVPPNPFIEVPFMESARIPELSLVGPTAPVREGDKITSFTINASESTDADLAIGVSISNVANANRGNFVENSNRLVRLPANQRTVTFEVDTIHDNVDEEDGVVNVNLVTNNTIYRINPEATNVFVDVLDIDGTAPVGVSVSILESDRSTVEGTPAKFQIVKSDTSFQRPIFVRYEATATDSNIFSSPITDTVTIPVDRPSQVASVDTTLDLTSELAADAGVELRILSAKEYHQAIYRVGTPASAKVLVRDKPPVIEVASKATGFAENDSGGAIFTISATGIISGKTINVNYNVTEVSGSYINFNAVNYNEPLTRSVVLTDSDGDGIYTGDLPAVVLHNDLVPETTGEIRVTLNADPEANDTYTLGTQNTATAEIYDDERPVIVVESAGDVTEGTDANATFNFIAKASPNRRITVNYTLLKTFGYSRFFNESANLSRNTINTTFQLDFTNNKKLHTYNIPLIADPFFRPSIEITLTLKDDDPVGSTYYLSDDDNEKAATIAISDDAEPTTLSVIEAPISILAGESFTFKVKVTPELGSNEDLVFAININDAIQGTTYLSHSNPGTITPLRIEQATHGSEYAFTVFTHRDGATSQHGEIQIQFRHTATTSRYQFSAIPASVQIIDPDLLPAVSITRVSSATIEEGESMEFDLIAADPPGAAEDIEVTYSVAQSGTGDFITTGNTFTETILSATNKGRINLTTVADTTNEQDSTITVTVLPDSGADRNNAIRYTVGNTAERPASAQVNVSDNDGAAGLPVATVTRVSPEEIYEGENAEFRFDVTNPPSGDNTVTVKYRTTAVGDYLENFVGPSMEQTIEIGSSGSKPLTFETTPDIVVEDPGSVRVQIIGDTPGSETYSVGFAPLNSVGSVPDFAASITLISDDQPGLPSISISRRSLATIQEGSVQDSSAQFHLNATAGAIPGDMIMINLNVTQVGNFLLNAAGTRPVPIRTGVVGDIYEVPLRPRNNKDEPHGEVTVTIEPDESDNPQYSVGSGNTATVGVEDADPFPTISINDPTMVNEGNDASENVMISFDVTLSAASGNIFTVDYEIGKKGDTAEADLDYEDASGTLTFQPDDTSESIVVAIIEDMKFEAPEEFTVILSNFRNISGVDQPVPANITDAEGTGRITNDDQRVMTLTTNNTQTFLGGIIEYEVSVDVPPFSDNAIPVAISVSDKAGTSDLTLVPSANLSIDNSGSAKGWVQVANTGTIAGRSPVEISISSPTTGYTFVPAMREVEVTIVDAPAATGITISGPSGSVDEGESAEFTLTADNMTRSTDLTISVSVADIAGRMDADYVTEGTLYAVLKADQESVILPVPTNSNKTPGIDGVVVATILDGVGYSHQTSSNKAYADVYDNDTLEPVIVSVSTGTGNVAEGTNVDFRLLRESGTGAVTVEYEIVVAGDVLADDFDVSTLPKEIPADQPHLDISVPTVQKSESLTNARVTLRIKSIHEDPTVTYRIGTQTAFRTIIDRIPQITLMGMPSSATQGHSFSFFVKSDLVPASSLPVGIQIDDMGTDILVSSEPAAALDSGMVMIPARCRYSCGYYNNGESGY